jgi:hypothetical protein
LTVTFTASGNCTSSSDGSVHLSAAGDCTITAHQGGNTSYRPAPEVSRTFSIAKAPATLVLGSLNSTYTGSPITVGVTSIPAGLSGVAITYNGSGTPPINPGDYAVIATLTHENYQAAPATGTLVIAKATATITLGDLTRTFSGSPQAVTATTTPAELGPISITYDGSSTPPVNAGSYSVIANLAHVGYQAAPATGTLVIAKASASITLGTSEFVYDGTAKQPQVTTSPAGLPGIVVTYGLDGVPVASPTNVGTYQVLVSLANPNYEAPYAIGTLTIVPATPTITWPAPSTIKPGTKLGAAELNATANGVGGVTLGGSFVYTPPAGTLLKPGTYVLALQFTPNDRNYTGAAATVSIEVSPSTKRVEPGETVPLKTKSNGSEKSSKK